MNEMDRIAQERARAEKSRKDTAATERANAEARERAAIASDVRAKIPRTLRALEKHGAPEAVLVSHTVKEIAGRWFWAKTTSTTVEQAAWILHEACDDSLLGHGGGEQYSYLLLVSDGKIYESETYRVSLRKSKAGLRYAEVTDYGDERIRSGLNALLARYDK